MTCVILHSREKYTLMKRRAKRHEEPLKFATMNPMKVELHAIDEVGTVVNGIRRPRRPRKWKKGSIEEGKGCPWHV
jgi:hypothetical protein